MKIIALGCGLVGRPMAVDLARETGFEITIVEGEQGGAARRFEYNLTDRADHESNPHSMVRATGHTATMAARMLAQGLYDRKGISPPELVGRCDDCVEFMLQGLAARGLSINEDNGD